MAVEFTNLAGLMAVVACRDIKLVQPLPGGSYRMKKSSNSMQKELNLTSRAGQNSEGQESSLDAFFW